MSLLLRASRPHAPVHARGLSYSLRPQRKLDGSPTSSSSGAAAAEKDADPGMLRMVMFGKPGAGKGTLSARLVSKYDIVSVSTGDLLRLHIAEGTDVGKQAEAIVARGGLIPDQVMLSILTSKLDHLHNKHWILDGFPRTLAQAQLLSTHLHARGAPLTLVVHLAVPDAAILARIADRWVHLPSGRVYNLGFSRPRVPGRDDVTGEPLVQRPDDTPEVFKRRLEAFYSTTAPILSYYSTPAADPSAPPPPQVATLSGSTSDEIWPHLDALVRARFPALRERPAAEREGSSASQRARAHVVVTMEEKRGCAEDGERRAAKLFQ